MNRNEPQAIGAELFPAGAGMNRSLAYITDRGKRGGYLFPAGAGMNRWNKFTNRLFPAGAGMNRTIGS